MIKLESTIRGLLKDRGCKLPEIGLLQPAEPILDAAGEDIRRRIFTMANAGGRPMCLRPEFTIPVCLAHIESARQRGRYGYAGKVFRQRSNEPDEFLQAGIEDIGKKNRIAADARCLADSVALLRGLGAGKLTITIGDQAIFQAVLDSLGLPKAWQDRLGRVFGDRKRVQADLDRLSGANGDAFLTSLPSKLVTALKSGDSETVKAAIDKRMRNAGLSPLSSRTVEEIAARLATKAELAAAQLNRDQRSALEGFLALDVPLEKADQRLWALARRYAITLGPALEEFHKRRTAIQRLELQDVKIRYKAEFGRRLDYYTGFVFEIRAAGSKAVKPLAGGGRYDRLLNVLGAEETVPAIGFAVWVERIGARKPRSPKTKKATKKATGKAAA